MRRLWNENPAGASLTTAFASFRFTESRRRLPTTTATEWSDIVMVSSSEDTVRRSPELPTRCVTHTRNRRGVPPRGTPRGLLPYFP
jgi:hypothetical protein